MTAAPEIPGVAWLPPSGQADLPKQTVHVWQISLAAQEDTVRHLAAVLAADEQARAARFNFAQDSRRYIAVRGALRLLLAGYLHQVAGTLRFGTTEYGKPFLLRADGLPDTEIAFNVSHSHELALLAFTRGMRVGVDVERVRPELAEGHIAERFFSPREVTVLRGLPQAEQPAAFFRCWTRKEAFVKARGEGLSLPLHSFDVSLAPDEPAALLDVATDPAEAQRWTLRALTPTLPGYMAALAVEGRDVALACYQVAELALLSRLARAEQ